jgi:hypothetical protein
MGVLKDTRFWIGAAAGFFVGPMVVRFVGMQVGRLRTKSA